MSEEHELSNNSPGREVVHPDAGREMEKRAVTGAAVTRALQAASIATKAPVAPAGIAGLGLATVLLFLNSTILSLGDTVAGNDVSLRDAALAVVLGFATLWWHGVPQAKGPPVIAALCALLLVVLAAGWLGAPTAVRVMDGVYAVLILGASGLRLASLGGGRTTPPAT